MHTTTCSSTRVVAGLSILLVLLERARILYDSYTSRNIIWIQSTYQLEVLPEQQLVSTRSLILWILSRVLCIVRIHTYQSTLASMHTMLLTYSLVVLCIVVLSSYSVYNNNNNTILLQSMDTPSRVVLCISTQYSSTLVVLCILQEQSTHTNINIIIIIIIYTTSQSTSQSSSSWHQLNEP